MSDAREDRRRSRPFAVALGGTLGIGLAALGLSFLLGAPLARQFRWSAGDAAIGLAAVAPLIGFLWWFSQSKTPALERFRQSQIEFFSGIGFEFTPLRIALMAAGAGIAEELMFRGVLQTWLAGTAPLIVAIVAPNIIFGLLHMRTALYAFIAGLVGVYLGALFALTGNLLTPIIAHGVYDLIALEYTRRAILAFRENSITQ